MSGRKAKPGDGDRGITSDEADLWGHATRALTPLKAKQRVKATAPAAPDAPPRPAPKEEARSAVAAPKREAIVPAPRVPAPPLADLDRRKVRQIASGKQEIDARIDLHGWRQGEAAERLRAFLLDAHARGLRTVLVITGKGGDQQHGDYMPDASGGARRGVLRRSVPLWLAEPALRAIVVGYTTAGVRHGGEGALYVQLRRRERSPD